MLAHQLFRGGRPLVAVRLAGLRSITVSSDSTSITYSGGHASPGQGGFYGSGGARKVDANSIKGGGRSILLALAADVQKIQSTMEDLERLESLLRSEEANGLSGKVIELKSGIKKLMTQPEVLESLNRLQVQGEPIWGLSSAEREMIITAREKVNEC